MTTEGFANDGTMLNILQQFDLAAEMKISEQQKPWQSGHTARTLFKKPDFRMVLISMDKGAILKEHHADGTISVQVLTGAIRFTAQAQPEAQTHTLHANHILTLAASIKHEVEALEPCAFLLTIAWPTAAALAAMPHRA
jgi:quercetin dioxygenase-like cupin family protein